MGAKTLLLLVEGPHDQEFCARLLKPMGFGRIQQHEILKERLPYWLPLVPGKWPQKGDLLARHPVPVFFSKSDKQSVAIINAVGLSKLATRLGIDLANLSILPDAIGIILDADDVGVPQKRHVELIKAIKVRPEPEAAELTFPENPGIVATGHPRCGVFVMPDNAAVGTLEDLLIEVGSQAYPELKQAAADYVGCINAVEGLTADDLIEFSKPAGQKKALVAAMSAVLKPGKAIQVSIQDNRWLEGPTLELPRIMKIQSFLNELMS